MELRRASEFLQLHLPNHQRWYAKWKFSWNMYTHCIYVLCTFGLYAQSVITVLTKFLHRSSVGSLLRVCCWLGTTSGDNVLNTCRCSDSSTAEQPAPHIEVLPYFPPSFLSRSLSTLSLLYTNFHPDGARGDGTR